MSNLIIMSSKICCLIYYSVVKVTMLKDNKMRRKAVKATDIKKSWESLKFFHPAPLVRR